MVEVLGTRLPYTVTPARATPAGAPDSLECGRSSWGGEVLTISNQRTTEGEAGKTVLITGASAGIGKETAKRLLAEGYAVYAAAHRVEKMRDLEKLGAVALKMDITNDADIVAGVERINAEQAGTAYAGLVDRLRGMRDRIANDDSLGSPPALVADTIAKALKAKRPKTRYAAGRYARPLLLLRRLLSDRMFDRVVARMAG